MFFMNLEAKDMLFDAFGHVFHCFGVARLLALFVFGRVLVIRKTLHGFISAYDAHKSLNIHI